MQRLFIVTGRSGSGKTTALHVLEDFGFLCIDNLPLSVLPGVVAALAKQMPDVRLALGVDARNPAQTLADFEQIYAQIKQIHVPEVLFLDAGDDALIARFADTRRKHPLQGAAGSLSAALELESERLEPLKTLTTSFIDTGLTNVHELKERLRIVLGESESLNVLFMSFGFKYGAPHDADFVFDVRMLTNPHWNAELRPLTGQDKLIKEFLNADPGVCSMIDSLHIFLSKWLPEVAASGRRSLTVAIGCTGGKHRSVFMSERLAHFFAGEFDTHVMHREQKRWA